MKSLSEHVNEALFETRFATGEIVQFLPTTTNCNDFNLNGSIYIIGRIVQIIIGSNGHFYDIQSDSGHFCKGVPNCQIKQETGEILTRDKYQSSVILNTDL